MNPHSVFLLEDCILPIRLDSHREPAGNGWAVVEDIASPVFDSMIRQAGWHFTRINGTCARRGFGKTEQSASGRALTRALDRVASRWNAAELDSVRDAQCLGFHIVTITVQPRQIQQRTSLD
jgi:hypothetical protein